MEREKKDKKYERNELEACFMFYMVVGFTKDYG